MYSLSQGGRFSTRAVGGSELIVRKAAFVTRRMGWFVGHGQSHRAGPFWKAGWRE